MGHDKLRKFAENEHFSCLLQPSAEEVLADGYFHLRDHEVKGRWNGMMFHGDPDAPLVLDAPISRSSTVSSLRTRSARSG